jgi:hypothetical protein
MTINMPYFLDVVCFPDLTPPAPEGSGMIGGLHVAPLRPPAEVGSHRARMADRALQKAGADRDAVVGA